mgnify:CR=1 FL=1
MEPFEHASFLKLRFATTKGELATEDLWALSLHTLDATAKTVYRALLGEQEESFLPMTMPRKTTHNELRLAILKHVIAWRVEKDLQARTRSEAQARLSRLKELAIQKQDANWAAQSMEELQGQIATLESALAPAEH